MFTWIKRLLGRKNNNDFTVIENGDRKIVISAEVMEYFNSTLPSPNPKDFEQLVNETKKIIISDRIVETGRDDLYPILEINDQEGIEIAGKHLAIKEKPGGHMLDGGYTIFDFYTKNNQKHTIEFLKGGSIRWKEKWKEDANLKEHELFLNWLYDLGVEKPLNEWKECVIQEEIWEKYHEEWMNAAPKSLVTALDMHYAYDYKKLLEELRKEFTNDQDIILSLLQLCGTGFGVWNGYPSIEAIPQQVLLKFPIDLLNEVCEKTDLSEPQKHGMARFFTNRDFQKSMKSQNVYVSEKIISELQTHLKAFDDQEKIQVFEKSLVRKA